jgi:hypothetical protein
MSRFRRFYTYIQHGDRATIDGRDVILLYGNPGELHETAIKFTGSVPTAKVVSGNGTIKQDSLNGTNLVLQYTTNGQTVVSIGDRILLYILGQQFEMIDLLKNTLLTQSI